jgi:hypothetical protein
MKRGDDIAILCPGPSLAGFLAAPVQHQLYIGVNRAVIAYPCDYWAFNDAEPFSWFEPQGRPVCFTSEAAFARIPVSPRLAEFEWLYYRDINTTCPSDPGWVNFTMTTALVLAEHLGAARVMMYGADQTGTDDWDGPPQRGRDARHEYRWQNERHKTGHVLEWMARRGVRVSRRLFGGTVERMNRLANWEEGFA